MTFTKKDIPILLLCFGTLLFPYVPRERLLGQWALVNVPVLLGLFYAYRKKIIRLTSPRINKLVLIPYLVTALLLLFLVPGNGWSLKRKILLILIYLLPSVCLCSDITDKTVAHRFQLIWLNCLRAICTFMFLCWMADAVIGEPLLQSRLAVFYRNPILHSMIENNRFVSYLGHPLSSTGIFLSLLVISTATRDIDSRTDKLYLFDAALSLFGVFACASKAALMLCLILVFYSAFKRKSLWEALFLILILIVYWYSGVAQGIVGRVEESIATGSISTGRAEALESMFSNDLLTFRLFRGNIFQYDNIEMIAALELPFLGWAFLCGIFFAVVQYLMYFVYPGLKVLLSGNLTLLLCVLVLMAFANANNGIYSFNDDLLIYSLNLWVILQVTPKNNILNKFLTKTYEKN